MKKKIKKSKETIVHLQEKKKRKKILKKYFLKINKNKKVKNRMKSTDKRTENLVL